VASAPISPSAASAAASADSSAASSPSGVSRVVLDSDDIARALTRIAHEILERNKGSDDVILLGIPSRGTPLAHRIAGVMSRVEGTEIPAGSLDITMYRDDLRMRPARAIGATDIPPRGIDDAVVVLVDDVLYSGRTIRAALDALNDVGRPRAVQLAVLVDRGHRELPIRADFVGKNLPTSLFERVSVTLSDFDPDHDDAPDGQAAQDRVVITTTPLDPAPANHGSAS
jgi:pyrimidine operon attenuation protein/uracil phosphoribosyltransferase